MSEYFNTLHTNGESSEPSGQNLNHSSGYSELKNWAEISKRKKNRRLGARVRRVHMHARPRRERARTDTWRLSERPQPNIQSTSSREPLKAKVRRVKIYHPSNEVRPKPEEVVVAEPAEEELTTQSTPEESAQPQEVTEASAQGEAEAPAQGETEAPAQDTAKTAPQGEPETPPQGGAEAPAKGEPGNPPNDKPKVQTREQELSKKSNSFTLTQEQQDIEVVSAGMLIDKAIRDSRDEAKAKLISNEIAKKIKAEEAANKTNKYKGKHFAEESKTIPEKLRDKFFHSKGFKAACLTAALGITMLFVGRAVVSSQSVTPEVVNSIKDPDSNDPNIGHDSTLREVNLDTDLDGSEVFAEKGIYDGYGEKGMWLSSAKGGDYDFASAKESAEVCGNDAREIVKYAAANQVECFADYLANLPEALQPEGFKGLTILETEHKLEGLSQEDFASVMKYFNNVMGKAFTRDTTLNGPHRNAFMCLANSSESVTHDNMELVACTTKEYGTKATEFFWTDDGTPEGNVIGTMTVKIQYDGNGNVVGGCIQVVSPDGTELVIYDGMREVTENPPASSTSEEPDENPSETPTEAPSETPTEAPSENPTEPEQPTEPDDSKNADAIRKNMDHNGRVKPMGSGELSDRPDTSQNSYQAELDYTAQLKDNARKADSESKYGETVGDIINNSDQTFANHGNFTEDQIQAKAQQAEAKASQAAADAKAKQMEFEVKQFESLDDAGAADWFNSTINNGEGNNGEANI